ncbi:MAG: phage tail tape measure protein [Lachnospiraceae bacterium]|nr:phage tail tape measure protein [Lachnospiraceae bacterium]
MKALDFVTSPVKGIINLLKNPIFQAGAVLGVSIGMKDTIDTYKDFESAMSQVAAISGATGSDFEKLNAKAKEMGATTKFTATEAAEGFNYMAMAGWKTKDMLNGIDGIMNLTAASGEELAAVSDIVTDALTAFGLKAGDSGHFADVLAQASANANTNVSMLGESFKYVAPVAGAMKYSVEDVSLALGLMANSSVKGSMAGTALKTSLANMASPTDKMEAAMKRYNISLEDGKGKMKTLKGVMDNLRKGLGGLSESEQTAAASTIFGKEAMAGMLSIINASEKDYKKLTKAVNNADGASKNMADTMLDNLEGSITLLQSALDGVKLSFGERLSPYVRGIAEWLTEMMPDVESALDDMMDFVDRKVSKLQAKFREISATDDWKNADFLGKVSIAWDEFIIEPFSEWWESTGKAKMAETAGDFGSVLGTGLNAGIMTLLGFDVSDSLDEGANIGRSFAKGFADGFDFDAISSKLWDGLGNLVKNAGKLLPGGESADLSSLLSAVTLAKVAGPLISAGSSAASLGKMVFGAGTGSEGATLARTLIGSASAGTGLAGVGANTAIKLGAGNLAGGASLSAGALSGIGLGAIAGGAVGGASLISGGMDIHKAVKADNLEEQDAYAESATWKIGGTASGAAIGMGIGSVVPGLGTAVGGLIGAGVGGIVGFVQGKKALEEYEEKMELARQESEKAEKVYAATGHSISDISFESKTLTDAMNDSSVSAEQLGLMFQKAVSDKLKGSFGDISLSLSEIKEIAGSITFDKQVKSMDKFEEAARNSGDSFQTLQSSMDNLDKANWEVGLGMKLKKSDKEEYRNAVDAYVESAGQYIENKHYEATVAMRLFVGKSDDSYADGLDGMYSKMQKKIQKWDNKLNAKIKVAMKDGIIDVNEEKEIARLQKKISRITNKVASAEEKASFASMKVRYSGSDLDAESFASLQEEIQANVDQMSGNYDSALQVSLTNLQLQLDEGEIDQKGYDKMLQKISDGYNKQIQGLQDRAQDFQLNAIADAFSSQLDGILPEIEGTTAEKFKEAMDHALSVQPDAAQWAPEDITKWFGLKDLDGEVREAISSMLQNTALSIPDSVSASFQENAQAFQEVLDSATMYDTFSAAGNTYGSSMTTGITAGIQQGGPLLRSAAETTVQRAFATPFSVAANINVTPSYNMASAFPLPNLSGEDTRLPLKKHASGGYASSKQLSWLAEEGWGEFIIPTNPSRRKRALELYEQAGRMLGVSEHAAGGFAAGAFDNGILPCKDGGNDGNRALGWKQQAPSAEWDDPTDGEYEAKPQIPFSLGDPGMNNPSGTSIQIDVQVNPEFNISASEGQNDEVIMQALRRHMREIADELGGEIASRLEGVFSNMPLGEA